MLHRLTEEGMEGNEGGRERGKEKKREMERVRLMLHPLHEGYTSKT
jgi:hypothetical protein